MQHLTIRSMAYNQHLTIRSMAFNAVIAAMMATVVWKMGLHYAFVVLTVLAFLFPPPYWRDIRRRARSAWNRQRR